MGLAGIQHCAHLMPFYAVSSRLPNASARHCIFAGAQHAADLAHDKSGERYTSSETQKHHHNLSVKKPRGRNELIRLLETIFNAMDEFILLPGVFPGLEGPQLDFKLCGLEGLLLSAGYVF